MRSTAIAVLVLTLLTPVSAQALQADDLVAIAAMPLAVAAVSELTDVPTNELIELVATLNQAQVPAPQFIEVVRYSPVALVDTSEPFVPYITSQVNQGVRGEALAVAIEDRIETYDGAESIDVVHAPRVVVVDRAWYPEVVVTRFQPADPLSLIAMPLAVAAAAEIADVPATELASLVSLLNQGRVPPRQFVEIVRYSPVALVDRDPAFLTFVTTQVSDGSRGIPLARLIDDRYDSLGFATVNVLNPPVLTDVLIPPLVTTRVAEVRAHPHGGPPGQLKKQLGVQTGAEVVHGAHPGRGKAKASRAEVRVTERRAKPRKQKVERVSRPERQVTRVERVEHHQPKAPKAAKVSRGHDGGGKPANAGGNGQGNPGKGKGKGKG
jgi:hypothetical protein